MVWRLFNYDSRVGIDVNFSSVYFRVQIGMHKKLVGLGTYVRWGDNFFTKRWIVLFLPFFVECIWYRITKKNRPGR